MPRPTLDDFRPGPRAVRHKSDGKVFVLDVDFDEPGEIRLASYPVGAPRPGQSEHRPCSSEALTELFAGLDLDPQTDLALETVAEFHAFRGQRYFAAAEATANVLRDWADNPAFPPEARALVRNTLREDPALATAWHALILSALTGACYAQDPQGKTWRSADAGGRTTAHRFTSRSAAETVADRYAVALGASPQVEPLTD